MNLSNKFLESVNILSGKVIYNDFDINENLPFEEQRYAYKEDIIQISFEGDYLIDVGFYPESDPSGCFLVVAIHHLNWEKPSFAVQCRSLSDLRIGIEEAAQFIEKEISEGRTRKKRDREIANGDI